MFSFSHLKDFIAGTTAVFFRDPSLRIKGSYTNRLDNKDDSQSAAVTLLWKLIVSHEVSLQAVTDRGQLSHRQTSVVFDRLATLLSCESSSDYTDMWQTWHTANSWERQHLTHYKWPPVDTTQGRTAAFCTCVLVLFSTLNRAVVAGFLMYHWCWRATPRIKFRYVILVVWSIVLFYFRPFKRKCDHKV